MFWKKTKLRRRAAVALQETGWTHKDIRKALRVKPSKIEKAASTTEEIRET